MFLLSSFIILSFIALTIIFSLTSNVVVNAWLHCDSPPKWDPHMIDTALKKFYEQTDGPNWPKAYRANWVNPKGLCALDGDVQRHPYPVGVQCVIGGWHYVPPKADGGLQHMELFHGKISGPIPDEFKSFQMADWLGFWNNSITGNLWDTSNHCFLHRLDLSHNKMSGVLNPTTFFTGSSKHLELLNFGYNQFSGNIPDTINNLLTISGIVFRNNQFSGTIPDMSKLTKLRHLDLSNNKLSGTIGKWLKQLSTLSVLNLDNNVGLSGPLPELPDSITRFQASGNNGFTGPIPESYGALPRLRHFNCTGCTKITCPRSDLFNHLAWSSHCKQERKY